MLLEEIMLLGFVGLVTGAITGIIITEGKRPVLVLYLILLGTTCGWFSGMLWIYLTGGLDINATAILLPVVFTLLASLTAIYFIGEKAIPISPKKATPLATLLAFGLLFAMAGVAFATNLPQTYKSEYAPVQYDKVSFLPSMPKITWRDAKRLSQPIYSNMVQIDKAKSYVRFPTIAENPQEGQYLEFKVTFHVSNADWEQPYIKLVVFQDANGNGVPDNGEYVWSDVHYKIATESGKKWRTNCIWQNNQPYIQFHVASVDGQLLIMPIFHANSLTVWKNEEGKTFGNTPEGYTAPYDMLSWELTDNTVQLKEQIQSFAVISKGSSVSIKGKIYCPEGSAGQHGLIIQAFDMRYTDPFDPSAEPLAQDIMPFTVSEGGDGGGGQPPVIDITYQSWVVAGLLVFGTVIASVATIRYLPKIV